MFNICNLCWLNDVRDYFSPNSPMLAPAKGFLCILGIYYKKKCLQLKHFVLRIFKYCVYTIRCTEDYMDPKCIQNHKMKSHSKFPLYGIKCFTAAILFYS